MLESDHAEQGNQNKKIRKAHEISPEEMEDIIDTFAISFEKYPLQEYFMNGNVSATKMKRVWKVVFKAMEDSAIFLSNGDHAMSAAVLIPDEKSDISLWQYIKHGGIPMVLKNGLPMAIRMLRFEKIAAEIRRKYATPGCWYFYIFATRPGFRHQGFGHLTLTTLTQFLDENQQDCYLETLSRVNVEIYERYGFELKEAARLFRTGSTLYAMIRPCQKPQKDEQQ